MNERKPTRPDLQLLGRRDFLGSSAALISVSALSSFPHVLQIAAAQAASPLFALGVASGDPTDNSVTLWTRLMPGGEPAAARAGQSVRVSYEVAEDESFRKLVHQGQVNARSEDAYSIHERVNGLKSDRWYYYCFEAQGQRSRIGRTRTFPKPNEPARRMRFALASCQDYQNGFFSAYSNMLSEDIDFVVHVGDYIYEDGARAGAPRQVTGGETLTLEDYRNRHATYRLDPALQAVHAAFPFIVTWDDHEVENNYAGAISEELVDPTEFLTRRAAAYKAYYEHMPLPRSAEPRGAAAQLYRRIDFGRLAQFNVLDTRQYRTDQPCGDAFPAYCEGLFDPNATLLGDAQERWLQRGLRTSKATWNVLAQQVMLTKWDGGVLTGFQSPLFNPDAWDGYQVARDRLLGFMAQAAVANPIVLTGDIHSSWVADLKRNFSDPNSSVVATEFVGTSISSDFPVQFIPQVEATLPSNLHIRYFDGLHRGYLVCEVTPQRWTTHYRGVESILVPESPLLRLATFVVEAGRPGAQMG